MLLLFIKNQIKRLIYPNSIIVIKYNNQKITDEFINSVIIFIFSFLFLFLILSMLLSITGLDFITSISGAASAISNVGPGLGDIIGPNGNYKSIPDQAKWLLSFGMLLGRLELFAVLVLFFPSSCLVVSSSLSSRLLSSCIFSSFCPLFSFRLFPLLLSSIFLPFFAVAHFEGSTAFPTL